MVSLWGSKTDDDPDATTTTTTHNGNGNGDSSNARPSHEADERTRLLVNHPAPPVHDGYLSPDDPAVRLSRVNLEQILHFLQHVKIDDTC